MAIDDLQRHWASYWPGADVAAMAADVAARHGRALEAWGLERLRSLDGGNVALVSAGWRDEEEVVLKVHPRGHPDDRHIAAEAAALRFWRRTGVVVPLLDSRDDDFTLLLTALRPGITLDESGISWDQRLELLARLAATLHAAGPPPASIPHIGDYARAWRASLAEEPALARELEALLRPRDDDVLLHADLHGANALRHGDEWKVIDPHAVRGDRHADVWALIDPLAPASSATVARARVARYADVAGLDRARAAAWTRLRARAEALALDASGDDPDWATRLHRMADALG